MEFYLNAMKEFVTRKTNHCIVDDFLESFRSPFIDFIYVYTYYYQIVHMKSPYMESIRSKVIADNSRFLNLYNTHNISYILKTVRNLNDKNNRYNEYYFDKFSTVYRLRENSNFLRLYCHAGLAHRLI